MPYTTRTDIEARYGENLISSYSDSRIAAAVAAGDAEIDAYLSPQYMVPFDPAPAIVAQLAIDLAVYYVTVPNGAEMTDDIRERYNNAVTLLKSIAAGDVRLGTAAPAASADPIVRCGDERRFVRGLEV